MKRRLLRESSGQAIDRPPQKEIEVVSITQERLKARYYREYERRDS